MDRQSYSCFGTVTAKATRPPPHPGPVRGNEREASKCYRKSFPESVFTGFHQEHLRCLHTGGCQGRMHLSQYSRYSYTVYNCNILYSVYCINKSDTYIILIKNINNNIYYQLRGNRLDLRPRPPPHPTTKSPSLSSAHGLALLPPHTPTLLYHAEGFFSSYDVCSYFSLLRVWQS